VAKRGRHFRASLLNTFPARTLRRNIKQGDTLEVHAAGEQLAFKVTVAGAK
jgi:hypothetical protein